MARITLSERKRGLQRREPAIREALGKWRDIRARGLRNAPHDFRIRQRFVALDLAASSGSERKLPPREDRPPATRLVTSQGNLLKFELAALADAQLRVRAGRRPRNPHPLMGDLQTAGWADLLALDATPTDSRHRRTYQEVADLRRGQITRTVLKLIDRDFLRQRRVDEDTDEQKEASIAPEGFLLQDEGGPPPRPSQDSNIPYCVPEQAGTFFTVPYELIENGWLHVLPESALVMVLLAARHYTPESEDFQISGHDRVRWHGIGPDTYRQHELLQDLGILSVTEDPGRKKLNDDIPRDKRRSLPHQIRLVPEAFKEDGVEQMLDYLS